MQTFTLEEANALLPRLTQALLRSIQILGAVQAAARRLEAAGVRARTPGELPTSLDTDDPELAASALRTRWMLDVAHEEAHALEELGVVIRDLSRGRVDFRSILEGQREVFLCWALGEPEVRYFHDLHAECGSRERIGDHRFFHSRQLVPPR